MYESTTKSHTRCRKVAGIGPGLLFAQHMVKEQSARIGLVPCAIGETSISDWQENGDIWSNTIQRTRDALATDPNAQLKGLLW